MRRPRLPDASPQEFHAYGDLARRSPVPLPPELDWVRLSPIEASAYRELRTFRGDLDFAIVVLGELLRVADGTEARSGERSLHRDDQRARWNAALIAYARVFMSGVGQRLKPDVFHADDAKRHSYYIRLRNRHVAHSVSDYEEAGVLVSLSRDEPRTVVDFLDYVTTEQLPGPDGVLGLLRLAETARDDVNRRLDIERDRLLVFARARVEDLAIRERLTSIPAARYEDAVPVRRDSKP